MARYDGTDKGDTYTGTAAFDHMFGYAGKDVLRGRDGNDVIDGGDDNDRLFGESGDDQLYGGKGDDRLDGGENNDTLSDSQGNNTLLGGNGDDIIRVSGAAATDRNSIDGGAGDDTVEVTGGSYAKLTGGAGTGDKLGIGTITLDGFGRANNFELLVRGGTVHGTAAGNVLDFSVLTVEAGQAMELKGWAGDDTLIGTTNGDKLSGGTENDLLKGGAGNDHLAGDENDDTLHGDAGDDHLDGGSGNDVLYGGADKDNLYGQQGDDLLDGGDGDDFLSDNSGSNTALGGKGNDTITLSNWTNALDSRVDAGEGDDKVTISHGTWSLLQGGEGIDTLSIHTAILTTFGAANGFEKFDGLFHITGSGGADSLDFSCLTNAQARSANGGIGVDAGGGDDLVKGTNLNDNLFGGEGKDVLWGMTGNDVLNGAQGDDEVHGGDGDDTVSDYGGNDTIYGDAGNDRIDSGLGDDHVEGGDGNDIISGGSGINTLLGGAGDDAITSESTDHIEGGDGDDTIYLFGHKKVATTLLGGEGTDTLRTNDNGFHIFTASAAGFEKVEFQNKVWGTDSDDRIDFSGVEVVSGRLYSNAGKGDDQIIGANTDNRIYGEEGDDVIEGGSGNDYLDGGVEGYINGKLEYGTDLASYAHATAGVTVDLRVTTAQDTKGAGTDTLVNFEGLVGSAFDDTLHATLKDDILRGGAGDDTLTGYAGHDTIDGGDGDDTIDGGLGLDTIDGGAGDDTILGGESVDTIRGGDGNDVLHGGFGADLIEGGAGDDTIHADGKWASGNVQEPPQPGDAVDVLKGGAGADTYVFTSKEDLSIGEAVVPGPGSGSVPSGHHTFAGLTATVEYRAAEGDRFDFSAMGLRMMGEWTPDTKLADGVYYELTPTGTRLHVYTDGTRNQHTTPNATIQLDSSVAFEEIAPGVIVGKPVLIGTEGDDVLVGTPADEPIRALGGDDVVEGGMGDDTMDGGAGVDTLSYAGASAGIALALTDQGTAVNTGGAGTDTFTGFENLRGSAHADTLTGDDATNVIEGGAGDDILHSSRGNDTLDGGAGADRFVLDMSDLKGGQTALVIDSADLIELVGFPTLEWIGSAPFNGEFSTEHPKGPTGNPEMRYTLSGDNTVVQIDTNGDGKADVRFVVRGQTAFTWDGEHLHKSDEIVRTVQLSNKDNSWVGMSGAEKVYGGKGDDLLRSEGGNDILYGEDGDDRMHGGDGNDMLLGGNGDDLMDGWAGRDTMIGGSGNDMYWVDDAGDVVIESLEEGVSIGRQTDTVGATVDYVLGENVEQLLQWGDADLVGTGNALDNHMTGNLGNNTLYGLAGNDTLDGLDGADTLVGGSGSDTYVVDNAGDVIVELAGEGRDTVHASISYTLGDTLEDLQLIGWEAINGTGNRGDNVLTGNDANNVLNGGVGKDVLNGGLGRDELWGGNGADRFTGTAEELHGDTIRDFATGDRIDLSAIDAVAGTPGNDTFALIGAAAFSGTAGELRVTVDASSSLYVVEGDMNGDAVADFSFEVVAATAPTLADFLL